MKNFRDFTHSTLSLALAVLISASLTTACTEIRESQIVVYQTNRHIYFKEGEIVIPTALDLEEVHEICQKRFKTDVLAALFKGMSEKISTKYDSDLQLNHRQKRFIPWVVAGLGISAAAWLGHAYTAINGKIDTLRLEMKGRVGYLEKLALSTQNETLGNFIAIRREMTTMSAKIKENICKVESSMGMMLADMHQTQEFDDLIQSMHSERLTTKIIPPSQMYDLVRSIPELYTTIYTSMPYLLYHTSRVSFNLAEVTGDILRGIISIPLIKRKERVNLHIGIKYINNQPIVFKPIYLSELSNKSVEACQHDVDSYICSENELKEPQMVKLTSPYLFEDGIVLINTDENATIKDPRLNLTSRQIRGPATCGFEDANTVIMNNQMIYTQSSIYHIKQPSIKFDLSPYPVKLDFATNAFHELENVINEQTTKSSVIHASHILLTVIICATLLIAIIFIHFKLREKSHMLSNLQKNIFLLNQVDSPEDTQPVLQRVTFV